MLTALCDTSPDVRHQQIVDLETLRAEAAEAVRSRKLSLAEVGELIGKHRSTVFRALSEPGGYADVLRDIIAAVTDYEVDEAPLFQYRRKGR